MIVVDNFYLILSFSHGCEIRFSALGICDLTDLSFSWIKYVFDSLSGNHCLWSAVMSFCTGWLVLIYVMPVAFFF